MSYLLVRLPYACAPLKVRPEHFFDRIAAAVGFNDLDFESVEFSDAFHVSTKDERFVYDLLHPRMMQMMLAERPQEFAVDHGWLSMHYYGRWQVPQFERVFAFVHSFINHWPRHLIADGGQMQT